MYKFYGIKFFLLYWSRVGNKNYSFPVGLCVFLERGLEAVAREPQVAHLASPVGVLLKVPQPRRVQACKLPLRLQDALSHGARRRANLGMYVNIVRHVAHNLEADRLFPAFIRQADYFQREIDCRVDPVGSGGDTIGQVHIVERFPTDGINPFGVFLRSGVLPSSPLSADRCFRVVFPGFAQAAGI